MNAPSLASVGVRRRKRRAKLVENQFAATCCEALLVITVFASVLAIGSVHMPVLLAICALAIVGGGLGMLAFRRPPTPAIVLAALGLFSLLQAIPLPARWVEVLSPASAAIWLRCLEPLKEPPLTRFPLSLDAGASIAEALKWFTYASVYLMAARVRLQRGSPWIVRFLFIASAAVCGITLWHGAKNMPLVYDVYEPHFAVNRWSVGPLLNSNNLAGYANLGLFAGFGLLLSSKVKLPRAPILFGMAIIVAAMLLSRSRGAIVSAILGAAPVGIWLLKRGRVRLSAAKMAKVGVPLLGAITLLVVLGRKTEWHSLGPANIERKISVWRWTLPMIREHAWFGIGRGAFETGLPPYLQPLAGDWTTVASHAENFVFQWIAEWGVPVGVFALVAVVGFVARECYYARAERLRLLVLVGVVVLLMQNLADLGLEVPALAIAAVVAVAATDREVGQALRAARGETLGKKAMLAAAAAVVLPGLLWLAAAKWSRSPVEEERRAASVSYHALAVADADEQAAFRVQVRAAMLRHPGESYFPLLGAALAFKTGRENPLPWIGRALELGPTNGHVHLLLADLLGSRGATRQAMLHLRLAAEYDTSLGSVIAQQVARWAPTMEVIQQAIPKGAYGPVILSAVCNTLSQIELKISCFRYAISQSPKDATLLNHLAESLLDATRKAVSPCIEGLSQDCLDEVERTAKMLAKVSPQSWRSQYLLGKKLEAQGDFIGAAAALGRACPPGSEGLPCARETVNVALASGSVPIIIAAVDAYSDRSCGDSAACAGALDSLGNMLDVAGKGRLAVTYFTKAAEAEGTSERWLRVARRASQLQLFGLARTALDRADRSPDATPLSRATTRALRSQAEGQPWRLGP
jgi:tetratricopeptide (TPR) repeat protein